MEWFQNKSNVISLLDFLIGANLIIDADEVIYFYKNLERYTDVFVIYAREIGVEKVIGMERK
jgi:hypothetical protein